MALYRNYTVVVQTAVAPYTPNNDLQVYLYEGKVEFKLNSGTGLIDVFTFGSTSLAPKVYTQSNVPATALAADPVNRPGEYDFVALDLSKAGTLSEEGQTLYSVVARPSIASDFSAAKVIIDSTDISDPNTKQILRTSIGGAASLNDNMYFAGGVVTYDDTASTNLPSVLFPILTNLPSSITSYTEQVTITPGAWAATGVKLLARFDVHYANINASPAIKVVWSGVPAYQTALGQWMIQLTSDQYNTYRSSSNFGSGGGLLNLIGIKSLLTISVNMGMDSVNVREFRSGVLPKSITTGTTREMPVIHATIVQTGPVAERQVGIGVWAYNGDVPYGNLHVKGGIGAKFTSAEYQSDVVDMIDLTFANATLATTAAAKLGYDTGHTGSYAKPSYAAASAGLYTINVGDNDSDAILRFVANSTYTRIGRVVTVSPDPETYPFIEMLSDDVYIWGSEGGYINVHKNGANDIVTKIMSDDGFGSSLCAFSADSTSSKFGYDVDNVVTGIEFGSKTINLLNYDSYILRSTLSNGSSTSSELHLGYNLSESPRLSIVSDYHDVNGGQARLVGNTSNGVDWTYFEASSLGTISASVTNSNASRIVFTGSNTDVKLGYTLSTQYLHFTSSSIDLKYANTSMLHAQSDSILMGYNTGGAVYFKANATTLLMQASANTYISVNTNSDNAIALWYARGAASHLILSETSLVTRLGYNLNDPSRPYIDITATTIDLHGALSLTSGLAVQSSSDITSNYGQFYSTVSDGTASLTGTYEIIEAETDINYWYNSRVSIDGSGTGLTLYTEFFKDDGNHFNLVYSKLVLSKDGAWLHSTSQGAMFLISTETSPGTACTVLSSGHIRNRPGSIDFSVWKIPTWGANVAGGDATLSSDSYNGAIALQEISTIQYLVVKTAGGWKKLALNAAY